MMPKARTDKLSVRQLVEETVIYDLESHKAHSLNAAAAFVWRHCDGLTSIAELARLLHAELKLPESEELVRLALDQLARRHLLEDATPMVLPPPARLSRRDALKRLAVAAIALPVIMTITRRKAWASTTVGPSSNCPPGTTQCTNLLATIHETSDQFLARLASPKLCCGGNEHCDFASGKCEPGAAPPATPACLATGLACAAGGTPCCNGPCPKGGTCA